MKKLITLLLILTLAFSLFASTSSSEPAQTSQPKSWWQTTIEDATFMYDLYFRATMLREDSFSLGGGINLGLETDSFQFAIYGLGDYFLDPIGGLGGAASLEYMIESGAMFAWKLAEAWISRSYIAIDFGYYMQFAKIPQDPDTLFLANNGFMIRPKFYTLLQISKHYNMSIGLYYQIPLYPQYSDYKGVGVSIAIL